MLLFTEISLWWSAFPLRTSNVYKASLMLIPPQGRGKQNSHFGIQNKRKLRRFSAFTTQKRFNTLFLKPLFVALSQHLLDNIVVPSTILRWTNNRELCYSPSKMSPISQQRGSSFRGKTRQLGWHITVAHTYGIFIHVHKQFLLSWVDQWVSDKWYLSSFIHCLRIHGVCWIGKNKSIFKRQKSIEQGSLSKPAIIPLACVLRYLG